MKKPDNALLSALNDFTPRLKIAKEGWGQFGSLAGNALLNTVLLRTVLKEKAENKSQLRLWLRSVTASSAGFCAGYALATAFFYRDPERFGLGPDADYLYSPADGKVTSIKEVVEPHFLNGPATQITIASNFLNVHLQRSPYSGRIAYIWKETGKTSVNYVGIQDSTGHKLLLAQTSRRFGNIQPKPSGLRLTAGQMIEQSDKIGVATFGMSSEVSLYIPATTNLQIMVQIGQQVKAAMTVVGKISE